MDLGYQGGDLLWMAEHGILTLSYQSTSYLADRVPELEFADLPFLFDDLDARAGRQGRQARRLSHPQDRGAHPRLPRARLFRERLPPRLEQAAPGAHARRTSPGMRVRLMPGKMHHRSFELLGAVPFSLDLKPGLEAIVSGAVDAQENPLANTVDYGAHKVHRYHTLTGHCYLSRGIYLQPRAVRELAAGAAGRRCRERGARSDRRAARACRRGREHRAQGDRKRGRRSRGADGGRARGVRARGQAAARRGAEALRRGDVCVIRLRAQANRHDAKAAKKINKTSAIRHRAPNRPGLCA